LVEEIYTKQPWLFESNAANIQKKQYSDNNVELKEACSFLKAYDFNYAASVLERYVT